MSGINTKEVSAAVGAADATAEALVIVDVFAGTAAAATVAAAAVAAAAVTVAVAAEAGVDDGRDEAGR